MAKIFGKLATYIIDCINIVEYIAIVAIWRVHWDLYDIVAYYSAWADYMNHIFVVTHFVTFFIFVSLGLTINIYGFAAGGGDDEQEEATEVKQLLSPVGKSPSNRVSYSYSSESISEKLETIHAIKLNAVRF